jgi:hypothetical protein
MEGNDLGLLKDYGHWIMSTILVGYGIMYSILSYDYDHH